MNRQFDAAIAIHRDALAADYPPPRKGLGRVYDLQRQQREDDYDEAWRVP